MTLRQGISELQVNVEQNVRRVRNERLVELWLTHVLSWKRFETTLFLVYGLD